MPTKTLGQVAYEGYQASASEREWFAMQGLQIQPWKTLPPTIQQAWEKAAETVIQHWEVVRRQVESRL